MDSMKYMVVVKNEICTERVKSCVINAEKDKYNVTFMNDRGYSYALKNVVVMDNPIVLNIDDYMVFTREGKQLFDIKRIYQFENKGEKYWHLIFDGFVLDYKKSELYVRENCLSESKTKNVFQYLEEVSDLSNIYNDKGENVLKKNYEKIERIKDNEKTAFIPNDRVLSLYLDSNKAGNEMQCGSVIFPFGCNQSQYKAVKNALAN